MSKNNQSCDDCPMAFSTPHSGAMLLFISIALVLGVLIAWWTHSAPSKMGALVIESLSQDSYSISADLTIREGDADEVKFHADGLISKPNGRAQFMLDGSQGDYSLFKDTEPSIILDADTLYLSHTLMEHLDGEDFAGLSGNGYTSFFLPTYQIPTINVKPEWITPIEICVNTYLSDIISYVKPPRITRFGFNAYRMTLDTKSSSALIGKLLDAGLWNTAQYTIELQGAQRDFMSAMERSSSAISSTLKAPVETLHNQWPDTITEGESMLRDKITSLKEALQGQIIKNRLHLSYSIQKSSNGAYVQKMHGEYADGSFDLTITICPGAVDVNVPQQATDLEIQLARLSS